MKSLATIPHVRITAVCDIYDGHLDEGVAAIVSQRPNAKLDPKILKRQIELYLSFLDTPETKGKPFGWQSEKDWADAVTTMQKAGLLKPEAKPSDFYTNDFVSQ